MSTMISEVYDAFKEAGASDEKARKAAEAIASYEAKIQDVTARLTLLTWMVGFNLAATFTVLGRLLFIH